MRHYVCNLRLVSDARYGMGVNPILVALALVFTISAALIFGVILGFIIVNAIVSAMRRTPKATTERALIIASSD